jgi:hypothetical protein
MTHTATPARGEAVEAIRDALQGAGCDPIPSGAGWAARCPAHRGGRRNLSLAQGNKGALLHCHRGCAVEAVVEALGMGRDALWDAPPSRPGTSPPQRGRAGRSGAQDARGEGDAPPDAPPPLPELRRPTEAELATIAERRGIGNTRALHLMVHHGILHTATYWGRPVWVVGDLARRSWRARRMDGRPWQLGDESPKSVSFRGYGNGWPMGLRIAHPWGGWQSAELVEGEGDLVAMYHAAEFWGWGDYQSIPCAMPGASSKWIDPEALAILAALPGGVRIWPDRGEAGEDAAEAWAEQIEQAGGWVRLGELPDGFKDIGEYVAARVRDRRITL